MEDAEEEARAQRQRLEAAEIFAFIFPLLDRMLLIDARRLPEHQPQRLGRREQRDRSGLRRALPPPALGRLPASAELVFSRLRLFAYLDGEMAQLVVEAALARQRRPPSIARPSAASPTLACAMRPKSFSGPRLEAGRGDRPAQERQRAGRGPGDLPRAASDLGARDAAACPSRGAPPVVLRAPLPHHPPPGPRPD